MIFLTISDNAGVGTVAVSADSFTDAAEQLRQLYATSGDGFAAATVIGVLLPQFTATVTPGNPPTVEFVGDAAAQQTIRNAAQTALQANAAYLALTGVTNAQAVAQVAALTRQVDGLIRLLLGNLTATG